MTQPTTVETTHTNGKDTSAEELKNRVIDNITETAEVAEDAVMQAAGQASEQLQKVAETSRTFVRENPGVALAGALGVGVIVGLALRGRD